MKKRSHPVVQQQPHSEAYSIVVPSPLKGKKIDIDSVIEGSGIVYD